MPEGVVRPEKLRAQCLRHGVPPHEINAAYNESDLLRLLRKYNIHSPQRLPSSSLAMQQAPSQQQLKRKMLDLERQMQQLADRRDFMGVYSCRADSPFTAHVRWQAEMLKQQYEKAKQEHDDFQERRLREVWHCTAVVQ